VIHVDRSDVKRPASLTQTLVELATAAASEFFRRDHRRRTQETFEFRPLWAEPDVQDALLRLFNSKCAFCETPTIPSPTSWSTGETAHFRPSSAAVNKDGTVAPDHYWWLAYEWSNLYLICGACNRSKGSRFPILGRRAEAQSDPTDEHRLLLDPCFDDPAPELVFQPDGTVASDTDRGRTTIEVFALNRPELVSARGAAYAAVSRDLSERLAAGIPAGVDLGAVYPAFMDPTQPWAAARRQAVAVLSAQNLGKMPSISGSIAGSVGQAAIGADIRQMAVKVGYDSFQAEQEQYSLDSTKVDDSFFLTSRTIQRIEIRNFRVIRELDIEMPRHEGAWLMLLGENGTGKSTLLQAVTLALMGETYRAKLTERLGLDAARYVRRGARRGSVRVWLNGLRKPIELRFRRDSREFDGTPPEPKTLIAAYGATRLLPRFGRHPVAAPRHADVDNLFNPFEPLADAEGWLLSVKRGRFQAAAKALKLMLPLDPKDRLMRRLPREGRPGAVVARVGGVTVSLDELSDGYQSVIAIATDAMKVLFDPWQTMSAAEGIIVIDELGAHLHPSWKMRIVATLRSVFPKVQFIVTTHDPLCLRGTRHGEVIVLERQRTAGVVAITDLPPVEGLRADQLLTSEHFGLSSTLDPDTEAMFDEYYELQAEHRPTDEQVARLAQLEGLLAERDLMGRDLRERAMLLAIDRYIAEIRDTADQKRRTELREAMLEEAKELYATIPPEPLVTS